MKNSLHIFQVFEIFKKPPDEYFITHQMNSYWEMLGRKAEREGIQLLSFEHHCQLYTSRLGYQSTNGFSKWYENKYYEKNDLEDVLHDLNLMNYLISVDKERKNEYHKIRNLAKIMRWCIDMIWVYSYLQYSMNIHF